MVYTRVILTGCSVETLGPRTLEPKGYSDRVFIWTLKGKSYNRTILTVEAIELKVYNQVTLKAYTYETLESKVYYQVTLSRLFIWTLEPKGYYQVTLTAFSY